MVWNKVRSGICQGMKSIPASEYLKIIHPTYSILKIIPDNSIRNYDSENIARVICNMYSIPIDRITIKNFHFTYKLPDKTAFFIDISKTKVDFYIITPEEYEKLIIEKCSSIWSKATIQKISSIPMFSPGAMKYEMLYKKEDALSLKIDRKSNDPLNAILNVLDIMEQDDRVGIFYNFLPGNQLAWKNKHRDTLEKIKKNLPIDKQKLNAGYIVMFLIDELMKIFMEAFSIIGNFIGDGKNITDEMAISTAGLNAFGRLSDSTMRKGDRNILDTQIVILSDSKDSLRKKNNVAAVCESYKVISEDNSLVYKPTKALVNFTDYKVKGAAINSISTEEATNFIQIPGRTLLEQHDNIEKIDILENPVPEELSHGYLCLGDATYKGKKYPAFLRDEYHLGNLPLTTIGPQGAGKSTFFVNYTKYAHSRKEPVIVIDFIKNCELSQDIENSLLQNDLCVIDCSNPDHLQGFGYNEIWPKDGSDFETLKVSNMISEQVMCLIDSINNEGLPLTSKMRRYISAASNIVFLNPNQKIKTVIDCLQDYRKRKEYIDKVPDSMKEILSDEINALSELDDYTITKEPNSKEILKEITGTKDSKIEGILDRINLLKENLYFKLMFSKTCENNMNLVHEVENGKVILIKIPDNEFPTTLEKNILVTYWCSKIWLMLQIRGSIYEKPKRCHIILDEIYQAPTAERLIKDKLAQSRKFGGKYTFSCHYLSEIEPLKDTLKGSGSSYMLFQGCDKANYNELREELLPYEVEDLLKMLQFHSLNLIKYEKGYAKFITVLPKPLK